MPGDGMDSEALAEARGRVSAFFGAIRRADGAERAAGGSGVVYRGVAAAGRTQVDRADGGTPGGRFAKAAAVCHRQSVGGRSGMAGDSPRVSGALGTAVGLDR